jgi:hypothetical protein
MFWVAPAPRYLGHLPPGQKESALASTSAMTLVDQRESPQSTSVGRRERRCNALDLLSLASADDSFEHCPPYLINEVIVDRVVSSEHSIDKRPIERVDKGFQIEIR